MSINLNLKTLTFGSDDAELDEKRGFLDTVFLKTSIYDRVKSQERELVIGRKGSGKSAICLMLQKAIEQGGDSTILVTPESLSQRRIEQLRIGSINQDESFVLSWKYVLLVMVGKKLLLESKTNRVKNVSSMNRVRSFLKANREVELTLFGKLFAHAGAFSKLELKAFGVEGALETRQVQEEKDAAEELDKYKLAIAESLDSRGGKKIVLLIDQVDEVWNQSEESAMMIIGLLKAVHDLNATLKNTLTILFLRSDIYDLLKFSDADKFHSLEERIKWNREDLKHLISNRGRVSAGLEPLDIATLWNTIFESTVYGQSSIDYMVERTMMRPRDLIQFCNRALAEAQDHQHHKILASDILDGEGQYSAWKLKDLGSEFSVQYQYLDELLALFQSFKVEFSRAEFETRYQESKVRLAKKHPEVQAISTGKMLQDLYIIGFLGTKRLGKSIFVFDDPMILLAEEKVITVHPAFHRALGLVQSPHDMIMVGQAMNSTFGGSINVTGDIVGRDKTVLIWRDSISSSRDELTRLMEELEFLKNLRADNENKISSIGSSADYQRRIEDTEQRIGMIMDRIRRLQEYLDSR